MNEVFELINSMAPYLLLGFLLAGIMHAFVPHGLYQRFLGDNSFRSKLNATLLGIPLPLCSCGVIPTAMSMKKEGASKGATVAFLISTPQTGVDSISATYSLIGFPFALIRPLAALFTAILGGILVDKLEGKNKPETAESDKTNGVGGDELPVKTFMQKIKSALHYAFVEMMQDIGKWLIVGLLIAGLITVFIPETFFDYFADKPLLSMLLVLISAIPMYLCATGSIPIAAALMMKGVSPGTALVLLMAGPAVNIASMLVIYKVLGKKTLMIYLLSIISGAILFGLSIDYLLPREWFTAPLSHIHSHEHGVSYFNLACLILFLFLLIKAFILRYRKPQSCTCHAECSCKEATGMKWTIEVKGMNCNHCKNSVEKAISEIKGVENVEINLANGQTTIYGQTDKVAIINAVESLGFSVITEEKDS